MRRTILLVLVVCLAAAACGRDQAKKPKYADISVVMPELPLPPEGKLVGRTGNEEALQLTFESPVPTTPMADYYRGMLATEPWRLVSDLKQPDGSVVLYAERKGSPSLWVRIWAPDGVGTSGSMVELAGGVARKAGSDSSASAATTTSTPPKRGARKARSAGNPEVN